jgi:hypothetical protein
MNCSLAGTGTLSDGRQQYCIRWATIRIIDRRCRFTLTTEHQQKLELQGDVDEERENTCRMRRSNRGPIAGSALVLLRNNRVSGFTLGGTFDGRSFYGNFRSR